jgi:hypothetical protein
MDKVEFVRSAALGGLLIDELAKHRLGSGQQPSWWQVSSGATFPPRGEAKIKSEQIRHSLSMSKSSTFPAAWLKSPGARTLFVNPLMTVS